MLPRLRLCPAGENGIGIVLSYLDARAPSRSRSPSTASKIKFLTYGWLTGLIRFRRSLKRRPQRRLNPKSLAAQSC